MIIFVFLLQKVSMRITCHLASFVVHTKRSFSGSFGSFYWWSSFLANLFFIKRSLRSNGRLFMSCYFLWRGELVAFHLDLPACSSSYRSIKKRDFRLCRVVVSLVFYSLIWCDTCFFSLLSLGSSSNWQATRWGGRMEREVWKLKRQGSKEGAAVLVCLCLLTSSCLQQR